MVKNFAYLLVGLLVVIMFFTPARNYMNNLFHHDKQELREEQIIGKVSGYNPRVEEIQKILRDAGFDLESIDGIMGAQTRAAIREFQKKKGLKPTGKIDSVTQLALNRENETIKASLRQHTETGTSSDRKSTLTAGDAQLDGGKDDLTKDRVGQIQTGLKEAGFYKGRIDGKIGPQTARAIRAFQKSKGLNPDGVVGLKTWAELAEYLKN